MHVPHGRIEVSGDDPLHARADRRLDKWLILNGQLCVDRTQEDGVDALQVLASMAGGSTVPSSVRI